MCDAAPEQRSGAAAGALLAALPGLKSCSIIVSSVMAAPSPLLPQRVCAAAPCACIHVIADDCFTGHDHPQNLHAAAMTDSARAQRAWLQPSNCIPDLPTLGPADGVLQLQHLAACLHGLQRAPLGGAAGWAACQRARQPATPPLSCTSKTYRATRKVLLQHCRLMCTPPTVAEQCWCVGGCGGRL